MKKVYIILPQSNNKRVLFGIKLLCRSLEKCGYAIEETTEEFIYADYRKINEWKIYAGVRDASKFIGSLEKDEILAYNSRKPEGEGFYIGTCAGKLIVISGGTDTGTLYGCLELAEQIEKNRSIPREIAFADAPVFKLRGPVIGLQKTTVEPPRQTYEYPVTPDRFPWFYDKDLWIDFLDMILKQRCNVIYIWSGHPFSSFIKLKDYPEALEVKEDVYQKNVELFKWLTEEADKRGIWVVLKFYNIHIPLPFAQKHGLELHQSKPMPLTADYTRKAIAEFVRSFPNIGLMVCLGEVLRGTNNEIYWFTNVILPGVKDGIKMANLKYEPPVILRAHDTDPQAVMAEARSIYSNLYTMSKYNGEGLTTWLPRGNWQKIHTDLSSMSSTHIINVHILADLEPFRYGSPSFIQKCVLAGKYRLGANGIHLYPLFYWDWPYSPDKCTPRLKQIYRDWLWFESWFRYAWNPDRDQKLERCYWVDRLSEHFGSHQAGEAVLDAFEASGECAPRILRRFGITEGNRQTMSLGMTMSQLTNPGRYRPNTELWKSASPQGERLDEYVVKELNNQVHVGETPQDIIEDVEYYADKAIDAIEKAKPHVHKNCEEFNRIANDMLAIKYMVYFYTNKVRAAIKILTYKHTMNEDMSGRFELLDEAVPFFENSLNWYKKLVDLTDETYLFANSMQTRQRKIPFPDGKQFSHWRDCLPFYENELQNFKRHLDELKKGITPKISEDARNNVAPLRQAPFKLHSADCETYTIKKGNSAFKDSEYIIQDFANELNGLTGIRFNMEDAIRKGISVDIELFENSRILIGYFNGKYPVWLQVPQLETNTHADDRGGLTPVLKNAVKITSCPQVNIHSLYYEKGRHEIYLGTGAYMIAGVVPEDEKINFRNAEMDKESLETLDWMYE